MEEDDFNEDFFLKNEVKPLDTNIFSDFVNSEKLYKDYYKDDNQYTNVHYIYVNKNNEIEKIKQKYVYMSKPNYILRDEMIGLLKRNSIDNNIRYTLLSILKINITIDPSDIKHLLSNDNLDYYKDIFFTPIKNIDTVTFEKTINMFQDLNDILIVFYEKNNNNLQNVAHKNITKKIYLNTNVSRKKTLKKPI